MDRWTSPPLSVLPPRGPAALVKSTDVPPKNKRPRSERRAALRAQRKDIGARQRLVAAGPGGAKDRPLVVSSASVVEGRARAVPCIQCGGELDLQQHAAPEATLRRVLLVCRLCHAPREIWFRIDAPVAN